MAAAVAVVTLAVAAVVFMEEVVVTMPFQEVAHAVLVVAHAALAVVLPVVDFVEVRFAVARFVVVVLTVDLLADRV